MHNLLAIIKGKLNNNFQKLMHFLDMKNGLYCECLEFVRCGGICFVCTTGNFPFLWCHFGLFGCKWVIFNIKSFDIMSLRI